MKPSRSGRLRKWSQGFISGSSNGLFYLVITLALVYTAYEVHEDIEHDQTAIQRQIEQTSLQAALQVEYYLQGWERIFGGFSETRCIKKKDPAECSDLFQRLLPRFPDAINFTAIDRHGERYASARPGQAAADRKIFAGPDNTFQSELIDPRADSVSGVRVAGMSARINDAQGQFDGLLTVHFSLDELRKKLLNKNHPEAISLLIINRQGTIIDVPQIASHWARKSLFEMMETKLPTTTEQSFDLSDGNTRYRANLTWIGVRQWGIVALRPAPNLLDSLIPQERLAFLYFLPIGLLIVIVTINMQRAKRSEEALSKSQQSLRSALAETENKVIKRTRSLAESEARYRMLYDHAPSAIIILDKEGKILDCNPNATTLTGYSRQELRGLNVSSITVGESPTNALTSNDDAGHSQGNGLRTRSRRKDGSEFPVLVSANAFPAAADNSSRLLTIWSDLSDIDREQHLRAQLQRRLQAVVDSTKDGVVLTDSEGCILYSNASLSKILGWTSEELHGQNVRILIPLSACPAHTIGLGKAIERGIELPQSQPVEHVALSKFGQEIPIELSVSSWSEHGEKYFSAIFRDLSEQKRAQERFRFTQKMEAVGILAGGIAHDFNNLLAIVMGHAQLAHDAAAETSPIRLYTQKISKAALRARSIIKQLLDFSRSGDEAPRTMSLATELKEIETLIDASHPRHIALSFNVEESVGPINAVPHQVQQVVINLINNACDAIGQQAGTVEISLTEETRSDDTSSLVGQLTPGRYAVLRIKDTGPGIREELISQIFLPFFTTKEVGRGTGLGLAVVRGIVEEIGGAIRVLNRPSGGACFEIFFPLSRTKLEYLETSPQIARGRGETILLVDDEPEVVEAYIQYLDNSGFQVIFANSAATALQIVADRGAEISAVISDLVMPETDGVTLATALRTALPDVPVLLLTGRGDSLTKPILEESLIAGVIAKPVEPQIIASELRRAIDQAAAQPA